MNDYLHVTGRLVSGDAFKKQPDKTEPDGKITVGGYFVGVAVPKVDTPGMDAATTAQAQQGAQTKAAVEAIAQAAWPNGESTYPNFAMKIKDGDQLPASKKEGYPGHWVFCFSQTWPFRVYNQGATQQFVDPKAVKRGDYIRVPFTSRGNSANVAQNQTPGVYLNAELIEFVGYGKAILAGVDPSTVMAQIGAAAVPAGASATPTAGGPPITTGPPAPGGQVEPHPGFLDPGHVMTAKAAGTTYEEFIAKGWNDAQLIEHGHMVAPTGGPPAPPTPGGPPAPPTPAKPVMTAKAAGVTYEEFTAKGWTDAKLLEHGYIEPDIAF